MIIIGDPDAEEGPGDVLRDEFRDFFLGHVGINEEVVIAQ